MVKLHAQCETVRKVNRFPDADMLSVSFSDRQNTETRGLNENVLVEVDDAGRVVRA